jgi:two-component system sensor histidine kinase BaeS
LRSLRLRLLISHLLPLLVIIPLAGVAIVYILETQVLLANLTSELAGQAVLVAELTTQRPAIWHDEDEAQAFAARVGSLSSSQLKVFDAEGRLMASSSSANAAIIGEKQASSGLLEALAGRIGSEITYPARSQENAATVFVPVFDSSQHVIGVVALARQFSSVYGRFRNLRLITLIVMSVVLILGAALGLALALNIERPLRRVTRALQQLSNGQTLSRIPEGGPEEIRFLQHAFNSLVERLRTLEETRRQLLANLVHEISRPLGALLSSVQALQGGANKDPALGPELLEGMEGEIRRLQHLADDLTHLHGQLLGKLELNRIPTRLNECLREILPPWREMAQDKGLQWEADIPTNMPLTMIDSDRVAQAVGNLLSNAVQYTPPGGKVMVAAGVKENEVWLRVSDTGPGISPEEQSRIFTPFYRGAASRRFSQGMGLGLSIAHEVISAHGGRLEVVSHLGAGSQFTLWLPIESPDPSPSAELSA